MKTMFLLLAVALTVTLSLGTTTFAAERSQGMMNQPQKGDTSMGSQQGSSSSPEMNRPGRADSAAKSQATGQQAKVAPAKATDLIGSTVRNDSGEDLGKISNLVIDRDGAVIFAILAHGGFLGVGEEVIPIPWRALRPGKEQSVVVISMTQEQLKKAPNLKEKDLANLDSPDLRQELNSYYSKAISASPGREGKGQWETEAGQAQQQRPGDARQLRPGQSQQ